MRDYLLYRLPELSRLACSRRAASLRLGTQTSGPAALLGLYPSLRSIRAAHTGSALLGTSGKVSGIRSSPDLLTAPRLVGAGAFYMGMSRPVHVGPGPSVKTAYAGLTVWNLSPKMCCRGRRPRRPAPPVPATPDKRRAGSSRPTRVLSQAPPAAIPLSRDFWSSYGTQV